MAEGQEVQFIEVSESQQGQRIDNFLRTRLKGAPKSLIYRIVRKGEVRVNKKRIKADYRVQAGDVVRVPPLRLAPESAVKEASESLRNLLAGSVVIEGPDWLVINKPSGLAVHGGSGVKIGLIEALRQVREDLDFLELVHRLDRDTSGCLLLAKNRESLLSLNTALRERRMEKGYLALVQGRWPARRDYVSARLERYDAGNGERRVRVDDNGKVSRTRFAVRETFPKVTLIEAEPVTGRTHQIRVHAAHAGHALLGDDKYGSAEGARIARSLRLDRLFLHALTLTFPDPRTGRPVQARAPLEPGLEKVLERARHGG
ncbi:RluA family pseudouridine synthase [Salinicola corii]|uniref:Pseudouridine synthase n=1 Tax=Salinicola corii TaxID=2606937 RepID=A0A640WFR8_9GAMM|nr:MULTISPECIES: RluA family pseudouridine synthase [Salinicola]KAA0019118.1 RluA family pseudouridine synthase [Salinicola corii]MAM57982.1 23S rRNA pseudouridine(955/2504/2580) synthase [Salinicola sp.]NRB57973.1 RluA family pseudouridine synthase [Salinicola sp.]